MFSRGLQHWSLVCTIEAAFKLSALLYLFVKGFGVYQKYNIGN